MAEKAYENLVEDDFACGEQSNVRPTGKGRINPEEREPRLFDLKLSTESMAEAKARFSAVSKENIQAVLQLRPTTAKEIGVDKRWLDRLIEMGMAYDSKPSIPKLKKLAAYFRWSSHLDLWRDDIVSKMASPFDSELQKWKESPNWQTAHKFLLLLDSGKFNFLKELVEKIDSLDANEYRVAYLEAEAKQLKAKPKSGSLKDKVAGLKKK
jgi:hypothetical protein